MPNCRIMAGVLAIGAVLVAPQLRAQAPQSLLGGFVDDYGGSHDISDTLWRHGQAARYQIVRWDTAGRFLIARNDEANPSDGGLWTRIDWMPLEAMAPYRWAFCMSAYRAPTADSAAAVSIADRTTPRTGCNGFPFTRMRVATDSTPAGTPYARDTLPESAPAR